MPGTVIAIDLGTLTIKGEKKLPRRRRVSDWRPAVVEACRLGRGGATVGAPSAVPFQPCKVTC